VNLYLKELQVVLSSEPVFKGTSSCPVK